jgi:hypothetical protein
MADIAATSIGNALGVGSAQDRDLQPREPATRARSSGSPIAAGLARDWWALRFGDAWRGVFHSCKLGHLSLYHLDDLPPHSFWTLKFDEHSENNAPPEH